MGSRTRRGARFQRAVSPIVATCPRRQARGAIRQSVEAMERAAHQLRESSPSNRGRGFGPSRRGRPPGLLFGLWLAMLSGMAATRFS